MRSSRWFPTALAGLLLMGGLAYADDGKKPTKEESSFGSLRAADPAETRKQAESWLKSVGKTDAGSRTAFTNIWEGETPLLDKIAATFTLGDEQAAKILAEARDADGAAPMQLPALLKDKGKPGFYRANLAAAYGKALTGRRVYEEALEALALAKPEEVADPASLFFHRAVCEHALMLKDRADGSVDRLLVDVQDAPERYRMVAALMHFDMMTWQDKDLGWVARKMGNIQRRLDLSRGGRETQKQQKEVLVRLDEMIKEMENQQKQSGS